MTVTTEQRFIVYSRRGSESNWVVWAHRDTEDDARDSLDRMSKILADREWRIERMTTSTESLDSESLREDPLAGANCGLCGATADNFHVPDDLWERVGLGAVQACFKCFRIAAWHNNVRPETAWQVTL